MENGKFPISDEKYEFNVIEKKITTEKIDDLESRKIKRNPKTCNRQNA